MEGAVSAVRHATAIKIGLKVFSFKPAHGPFSSGQGPYAGEEKERVNLQDSLSGKSVPKPLGISHHLTNVRQNSRPSGGGFPVPCESPRRTKMLRQEKDLGYNCRTIRSERSLWESLLRLFIKLFNLRTRRPAGLFSCCPGTLERPCALIILTPYSCPSTFQLSQV